MGRQRTERSDGRHAREQRGCSLLERRAILAEMMLSEHGDYRSAKKSVGTGTHEEEERGNLVRRCKVGFLC